MLEPVEIYVVRACHFKRKPKDPDTGKKRLGCARCGRPRNDPDHLGAPESFNVFASSGWAEYQSAKQRWAKVLGPLLAASGLEPCSRITVEGEATFPDRQKRDQGNFRVIIEKALGDCLTEGGWLEDDTWERYEFGNLAYRYEKGVSATRLLIFPSFDVEEPEVVAGASMDPVAPALFG